MFKFRQCSKCKNIHLFKRAFMQRISWAGEQWGRYRYTICKKCALLILKEELYKQNIGDLE